MLIEPLLRNGLQGRTDNVAKKVEHIAKGYTGNISRRLLDYEYKWWVAVERTACGDYALA